ncbi:hypothetical protein [Haloprofundus sp. MHR1]|uniref:hypothetical protein n=1 Tax=Haloprofundus sp. MHR1 TaxID=2572921 RepID=UPI0010BE4991|nr:hypothetical protein [Haloprofundus sp. MHR1]QCJ45989.1 hypothetical protein FCF25_02125 [Haloprofundus sp. MHR1]
MIELVLTALGLGVAGLDPTKALFAAGALSGGARKQDVTLYGLISIVGTLVFGTVLTVVLGPRISELDWTVFVPTDPVIATLEFGLGVGFLGWGLLRLKNSTTQTPSSRIPRGTSLPALVGLGLFFALTAFVDPMFVSLIVVASRETSLWSVVAAHSVWILISQAPLVIILGAICCGKHEGVVTEFQSRWVQIRPVVSRIVTIALFVVAMLLLSDASWWFFAGEFLILS